MATGKSRRSNASFTWASSELSPLIHSRRKPLYFLFPVRLCGRYPANGVGHGTDSLSAVCDRAEQCPYAFPAKTTAKFFFRNNGVRATAAVLLYGKSIVLSSCSVSKMQLQAELLLVLLFIGDLLNIKKALPSPYTVDGAINASFAPSTRLLSTI